MTTHPPGRVPTAGQVRAVLQQQRKAHRVPLAAVTAWTALALPALLGANPVTIALIPLGAVAVTQRITSRRDPAYGAVLFETGFGTVPIDFIGQMLQGVVLLVLLVGVQVLLA